MRKLLLLLFISSLMSALVNAQEFRPVMVPGIQPINSGCIVDANNLFLAGSKQSIYKTTDGGNTWAEKFITDNTAYAGWGVSFGTPEVGYSVGYKGRVIKSTDAGETWNWINSPDTTFTLYAVKFFDADNGYVLGVKSSTSNLYKTVDGGVTWTIATTISGTLENMAFFSSTRGILVGGGTGLQGMLLYYTTDGNTWTKAPIPTIPSYGYTKLNLHSVTYASENTAYACGWGSYVGMQPSLFVKTTDGGATWTYLDQSTENKVYVNMNCIYFKDELNGVAGGQYTNPGTVICKTTDGGLNWIQTFVPSGFSPKTMLGMGEKLIMSGGGGNILISTDFGGSWTSKNPIPTSTLYSLKVVGNKIFAGGYESNFYRSLDYGNTFTSSFLSQGDVSLRPNDLAFVDGNTGYAACMYGQVLKTNNAGDSWTEVLPDTNVTSRNNNGIYFLNANTGFAVGVLSSNLDVIYKTMDGGSTWTQKSNLISRTLNCISFADDNHGAAGGNNGNILFTTDQGESWTAAVTNLTTEPAIKDIQFFDSQNGLAVGDLILKTSNAGAEWIPVTVAFLDKQLESVSYKDQSNIYAGGDKYLIKSTDGGNTWDLAGDTAYFKTNKINSIDIDDSGFLWIATSTGIILTSSPYNSINEEVAEPNSFVLEQNYPNPFNPTTTISFTLAKRGFVNLKLFDILGRVVKEIYKGEMEAGKHEIILNASDLASGSYIYSLQVNNQFTGRKLTLMK